MPLGLDYSIFHKQTTYLGLAISFPSLDNNANKDKGGPGSTRGRHGSGLESNAGCNHILFPIKLLEFILLTFGRDCFAKKLKPELRKWWKMSKKAGLWETEIVWLRNAKSRILQHCIGSQNYRKWWLINGWLQSLESKLRNNRLRKFKQYKQQKTQNVP